VESAACAIAFLAILTEARCPHALQAAKLQADAEMRQLAQEQEHIARRDAKAARLAKLQLELVSLRQQAQKLAPGSAAPGRCSGVELVKFKAAVKEAGPWISRTW